jgi:hypothetical protein
MRLKLIFPLLLAFSLTVGRAAPTATNTTSPERVLLISPSSTRVGFSKVTLTVEPLVRANGVYSGNYKISVFPYFFKNQKGKLAIVVPDQAMAEINRGKVTGVVGTATSLGEGICRPITATAFPTDINSGTINLWFMAGKRKMIFEPAYHFSEKALSSKIETPPS